MWLSGRELAYHVKVLVIPSTTKKKIKGVSK
jgi:hypothetical protein